MERSRFTEKQSISLLREARGRTLKAPQAENVKLKKQPSPPDDHLQGT